jgi:hypothetical protein
MQGFHAGIGPAVVGRPIRFLVAEDLSDGGIHDRVQVALADCLPPVRSRLLPDELVSGDEHKRPGPRTRPDLRFYVVSVTGFEPVTSSVTTAYRTLTNHYLTRSSCCYAARALCLGQQLSSSRSAPDHAKDPVLAALDRSARHPAGESSGRQRRRRPDRAPGGCPPSAIGWLSIQGYWKAARDPGEGGCPCPHRPRGGARRRRRGG